MTIQRVKCARGVLFGVIGVVSTLALGACSDNEDTPTPGPTMGVDAGFETVDSGGVVPDAGTMDASVVPPASPELLGIFVNQFFSEEEITEDTWSGSAIVELDTDTNVVFTQTPTSSMFNPGKFNRLVYTEPAGEVFYYCTETFGNDTVQDARAATEQADANDLDGMGCFGFPWTRLQLRVEVVGEYMNQFDLRETVTSTRWNNEALLEWSNETNVVFTQTPLTSMFNPGKFNRLIYTEPDTERQFYYCFETFGNDTLEEARMAPAIADEMDLEGAGCGGFPWTRMMPQ